MWLALALYALAFVLGLLLVRGASKADSAQRSAVFRQARRAR